MFIPLIKTAKENTVINNMVEMIESIFFVCELLKK